MCLLITNRFTKRLPNVGSILLLLILINGCSGYKTYPDKYRKNITILTVAYSSSKTLKVTASMDIFYVNKECKTIYSGTVALDKKKIKIGIPVNKASYLKILFVTSSFFSSSKETVYERTVLIPKSGYRYKIYNNYVDDVYSVKVMEYRPGYKKFRRIKLTAFRGC